MPAEEGAISGPIDWAQRFRLDEKRSDRFHQQRAALIEQIQVDGLDITADLEGARIQHARPKRHRAAWMLVSAVLGAIVGIGVPLWLQVRFQLTGDGWFSASIFFFLASMLPALWASQRAKADPFIETLEILDGVLRYRGPQVQWTVRLDEITAIQGRQAAVVETTQQKHHLPAPFNQSSVRALLQLEAARVQEDDAERVATPAPPKALQRLRET